MGLDKDTLCVIEKMIKKNHIVNKVPGVQEKSASFGGLSEKAELSHCNNEITPRNKINKTKPFKDFGWIG